ncbi:unnamed protein product [Protopolystoma xenopodis]|uniref:Uncharacterized protein n=1 Tax=Protopolystoma xenopodis TaxID=117903 RepID=A0A3S5CKL4_9PLAT|nr:unnamed protein product [Protopolystoma xenopodis]
MCDPNYFSQLAASMDVLEMAVYLVFSLVNAVVCLILLPSRQHDDSAASARLPASSSRLGESAAREGGVAG